MSKMQELLRQREELEAAIEKERAEGRAEALKAVRALIKEYGFTATQLKGVMKTRGRPSAARATRTKK